MPDAILFKPGALSDDEFALIAQHPVIGSEILRDVDFLGEGKLVVRHHHERWDGTGYPDRLAGDEIPLAARVFAVADALDALTTDRPYRRGTRFSARPRGDPRPLRLAVRPRRGRRLRHDPRRAVRRAAGRGRVTRTILIVDDDPMIRKLIATTLEDVSGYRLQEASNGAEAVERAVEARPEIVFLDVDMPRAERDRGVPAAALGPGHGGRDDRDADRRLGRRRPSAARWRRARISSSPSRSRRCTCCGWWIASARTG